MNEDSALFKYELAIVAILKNEAPYIKEWIDYHLLAGVEHFYLYDNDSDDNLKEVLKPYIDKGIVDYDFISGKCAQMAAYNKSIQNYKFDCRYIAFIDADEFIFPQAEKSIKDILNEILNENKIAAGLTVNWHMFGSSGHEKADLNHGVLERFLYRTSDDFIGPSKDGGNALIKTIVNPRCVDSMALPHNCKYW